MRAAADSADKMESASELEQLEKMVANAAENQRLRELERKTAAAVSTRPWTKEDEQAAIELVEMAKESVHLRSLERKRRELRK